MESNYNNFNKNLHRLRHQIIYDHATNLIQAQTEMLKRAYPLTYHFVHNSPYYVPTFEDFINAL